MNWTPFIPEEDESRISYTVRMPDAAPNEAENAEQPRNRYNTRGVGIKNQGVRRRRLSGPFRIPVPIRGGAGR